VEYEKSIKMSCSEAVAVVERKSAIGEVRLGSSVPEVFKAKGIAN
jgi:hypothetical protein